MILKKIKKQFHRLLKIIISICKGELNSPYAQWLISNKNILDSIELNNFSLVIDGGAYKGEFAKKIYKEYHCQIHCFEPIPMFSKNLTKRFEKTPEILIFPLALTNENTTLKISIDNNASGVYFKNKNYIEVGSIDIISHIHKFKLNRIDLLKLNVEGLEYEILERLMSQRKITNIKQLLVQFHDFVPEHKKRYLKIVENLSKTHNLIWRFEFIWELWIIK